MCTIGPSSLYLPDCDSYLRDSITLLANDDDWLSVRAQHGIRAAGLYLLHPSISLTVASNLDVPSISNIFIEKLDLKNFPTDPFGELMGDLGPNDENIWNPPGVTGEIDLINKITSSLYSDEFVSAIHALTLNKIMDNQKDSGGGVGGKENGGGKRRRNIFEHNEIGICCKNISLRFVDYLPVKLVLNVSKGPPGRINSQIYSTLYLFFWLKLF